MKQRAKQKRGTQQTEQSIARTTQKQNEDEEHKPDMQTLEEQRNTAQHTVQLVGDDTQ